MKASAYQENAEEFMLYAIEAGNLTVSALNEECSHKVYKSLRLAKSAKTQLEKWPGRKYGIMRRKITYGPWESLKEV